MRRQPRRVFAQSISAPAGLDPHHLHVAVFQKLVEQPNRI
jgi:hypothetical protein